MVGVWVYAQDPKPSTHLEPHDQALSLNIGKAQVDIAGVPACMDEQQHKEGRGGQHAQRDYKYGGMPISNSTRGKR